MGKEGNLVLVGSNVDEVKEEYLHLQKIISALQTGIQKESQTETNVTATVH